MEVLHRCKASKEVEDVISSMPEDVIANIMDRLPLKDAVATSILSPSWRSKWTLLTQLVLDPHFFFNFLNRKFPFDKNYITRLILHLQGAVTNFDLFISNWIKIDDEDIHDWVMLLSKMRGFKELTLWNTRTPIQLPTPIFSCLELKHLKLCECVLSPSTYFRGFPKLLTLELVHVGFQDHKYGELIAQCPLLQTLKISNRHLRGELKVVEIVKLENVKVLCLSLCLLDNMAMVRLSTVFQHMSLVPKLQKLDLDFENCKFLAEDVAHNPVSITFPFLKTLTLCQMDFSNVSMVSCAFGMLFGCTNLQNLQITAIYKNAVPIPAIFPQEVDCNTMGQLQLRNVNLALIKGLENEVCLIKCILACSPILKSINIRLNWLVESNVNEKYKIASTLLKFHRASPVAEVIF
uniref:F-box/FBD/LRR-repeat protein At1g13570-like n=1 Tax=Erigeron canadensis TaxID=72917 RepID=UPI001CB928B7|nr:F-box/FBD/LRR-repeat protein At1g13570-like [Erigeron canadensis]